MNIAIVSDVIYEYISGLAIFTKRLINKVKERVEKVIVITASTNQRIEEDDNTRIHYLKALQFKKFENMPLGIHPLPSIKNIFLDEGVDVVHCQSPALLGLASVLHANKIQIPVIFTHHFQAENLTKNFNIRSQNFKRMLYNYGNWLFGKCDHVTCPSHYAKKELMDMGIRPAEKMSVISNGVDAEFFKPAKVNEKTILFVGRLMPEKCVDTLILASAEVNRHYPEYRFIVVGGGYSMPGLKALAGKVNPSVVFTNKITEAKLLSYYQSCAMFVLPSELELQGIALLEAMACGKPTIASDSQTSAAGELANFVFRHGDHAELADKIVHLIEHPCEALELGRQNRAIVEREHDYSKITDKFINLYRDVISRKNGLAVCTAGWPGS
jgi:glycosyltransferase involved in cell wall biosynthesis